MYSGILTWIMDETRSSWNALEVLVVEERDYDFGLMSDMWGSVARVIIMSLNIGRVTVSISNPMVYPENVSLTINKYR